MSRTRETDGNVLSFEPSKGRRVKEGGEREHAEGKPVTLDPGTRSGNAPAKHPGGRRHKRWRIRVVRIDSRKYPKFACDRNHPFARMAAEARIEEIDTFLARLRASRRSPKPEPGGLSAAA